MIRAHSLVVDKEALKGFSTKTVYFQNATAEVFLKQRKGGKWRFRISEFSRIALAKYSEVICTNFSEAAWQTIEPWLVVDGQASDELIKQIYRDFLGWFIAVTAEEDLTYYSVTEEVRKGNALVIQQVKEEKILSLPIKLTVLPRLFLRDFVEKPKQLSHSYQYKPKNRTDEETKEIIPGKVKKKEFMFPKKWFYSDSGTGAEIISEEVDLPCLLELGKYLEKTRLNVDSNVFKNQYFRYVMTLDCVESDTDENEIVFLVKSCARRMIYSSLYNEKAENHFFPRKHKRTMFVEELKTNRILQFPLGSKNGHAYFSLYQETKSMLKDIGYDIQVQPILRNPHAYYGENNNEMSIFIPYKTDDKKHLNLIESGLSKLEKKFMFEMFKDSYPSLKQAHSDWELITIKNVNLTQGKLTLGPIISHGERTIKIEVVSTKDILPYLSNILKEFNEYEDKQKRNPYIIEKVNDYNYRLKDISNEKNALYNVEFIKRDDLLPIVKPMEGNEDLTKEEREHVRKKEIINAFKANEKDEILPSIHYMLLEIDNYPNNDAKDPYDIVKKTLLSKKRIVQCFHPLDENKDSECQFVLRSCLSDLFARRGMTNQMYNYSSYKDLFSKHVFYFPMIYERKINEETKEYLYMLSRLKDESLTFMYPGTEWLSLEESLVYIGCKDLNEKWMGGHQEFPKWIENQVTEPNAVLVFESQHRPKGLKFKNYNVVVYDITSNKRPYIENLDKNDLPSTGAFLVKEGSLYHCIPPKLKTAQKSDRFTKGELNKPISHRQTMKMKILRDDEDIAKSIFFMRQIAITYDNYLNHPLPLHLMRHHIKELKRLEPNKAALVH